MKSRKLNLRDLFWLVLVCGLVVAWRIDHRELGARVFVNEWRMQFWPDEPGETLEVRVNAEGEEWINPGFAASDGRGN